VGPRSQQSYCAGWLVGFFPFDDAPLNEGMTAATNRSQKQMHQEEANPMLPSEKVAAVERRGRTGVEGRTADLLDEKHQARAVPAVTGRASNLLR
jgi:hypothetical protein